jgi:thiamine monophosphate kinase
VGCVLELASLPRPRDATLAHELSVDLEQLALTGGEDYELLIAAPTPPSGAEFTRIGTFCSERTIRLQDDSGALRATEATGFDHFGV